MTEWIAIDQKDMNAKVPKVREYVLVCDGLGQMFVAQYVLNKYSSGNGGDRHDFLDYDCQALHITHWMPLPKLPKSD